MGSDVDDCPSQLHCLQPGRRRGRTSQQISEEGKQEHRRDEDSGNAAAISLGGYSACRPAGGPGWEGLSGWYRGTRRLAAALPVLRF